MSEVLICAKCGSDRIVPNARVRDRGHLNSDAGNLTLIVYEKPDALLFKGAHQGELAARVCGDCGFTELFVEDAPELYDVYRQSLETFEDEIDDEA